uniref:Uncharacterized protein n=1 Tax=Octopus bimaculoides TaxID=37653 RepID=A0A0L8FNB6_OCTBM
MLFHSVETEDMSNICISKMCRASKPFTCRHLLKTNWGQSTTNKFHHKKERYFKKLKQNV